MLSGKRSAILDLDHPPNRAQLESLLATTDVRVQGYRPGLLQRHRLDAAAVAHLHPHLSVVTMSAWGRKGLWATRRGFDSLLQCLTGISAGSNNGGQLGALPAQVLDHGTGYLAAAAAMFALAGTVSGEPPAYISLSLAQTAQRLIGGLSNGSDVPPERPLVPASRMVRLAGSPMPVHVLQPPGLVGDLRPAWSGPPTTAATLPNGRRHHQMSPDPRRRPMNAGQWSVLVLGAVFVGFSKTGHGLGSTVRGVRARRAVRPTFGASRRPHHTGLPRARGQRPGAHSTPCRHRRHTHRVRDHGRERRRTHHLALSAA